ncbi:MAG: hypothetical protein ACYTDW_19320 [Planctomycetota bacterium]|jgi:hypothetical protein
MEVDETQLIEFFGVLPVHEDPEEKEFFGSSMFEITQRDLKLSVSFSSHYEDMSLRLLFEGSQESFMEATIKCLSGIRVQSDPKVLSVVGKTRGASGSDPDSVVRVMITLDPLRVVISD